MSSEHLHEREDALSTETRELHRGIVSLIEELEAIDWYRQRAEACTDDGLREVLLHHMREETEHAMMNLEWLRRRNADFDRQARTYLFTDGPITEVEEESKSGSPSAASASSAGQIFGSTGRSLGIGSLKGT